MTTLTHTGFLAARHAKPLLRQPWYLGVTLSQPLIWMVLFGELFGEVANLPGFPTTSYIAYLTPGLVLMTAIFINSWNGMGLLDDMEGGVLDRFLASPVSRSALLNGVALPQALSLLLQSGVLMAVALLLGARFEGGVAGFVVMVGVAALLGATFSGFSMGTALAVRQRESVIGFNQFLMLPGLFLSTAFMPEQLLPGWIATVARYNPVDWGVAAAREALLTSSPDWGLVMPRAGLLALLALISTLVATGAFRSYQRSI